MKYGQITFSDLRQVWRIIVAVIICQVIGGVITSAISFHHFWFMNLWLGGAIGTLPGFVLGAIWQWKDKVRGKQSIGVTCFLGFISIALFGAAIGMEMPRMKKEMHSLVILSQLQNETIDQIDILNRSGDKTILKVSDAEDITSFTRACSDATGHSPNHPRYSHSWYVVLSGDSKHEFNLHLNPKNPNSVIGYFVKKSGNTTYYNGSFESHALRAWVEEHLVKENTN